MARNELGLLGHIPMAESARWPLLVSAGRFGLAPPSTEPSASARVNSGALRALGNYEDAFVWFGRAYQEQSNILQYLKVHPFFDPVRADPRFAGMIHDVGLDQAY